MAPEGAPGFALMAFALFGYNGVFEFDQSIVNKLLATFLYERHLVPTDASVTDGDLVATRIPFEGGDIHIFLEVARPFLHAQTSDGSNLVTLHVPVADVGLFSTSNQQTQHAANVPKLALVVFDVAVQQTAEGLSFDFSTLTADKIGIESISIDPGLTGVGGTQTGSTPPLDDATLDALIAGATGNSLVKAKDLRATLAGQLKGGALGPTSVPIAPGGGQSAFASFDLLLYGDANDRDFTHQPGDAGADLLLFQDPQHGRGLRTQARPTIPPTPGDSQFSWSASLSQLVVQGDIERALDGGVYWVQGGTANTAENVSGYLIVPGAGTLTFGLPGNGSVIVHAPQGRQVALDISGLSRNGRAHISNLDRSVRADFQASDKGVASTSIRADVGERLAISIDAVSLPTDSSIVIWRPRISFGEGELDVSFHYYKYIEHMCDAEGDATVRLALYADRSKPLSVGVRALDANASAPWWTYALAWLGPSLVGQGIFAPILTALVPTIMHAVAQSLIGGNIGSLADALTTHVSAPSPENVALVLDQVDLYETGIQISGRADSGILLSYGRKAGFSTQSGLAISSTVPAPAYMRFDWQPGLGSIDITSPVRWALIADRAEHTFWSATYDDLPDDTAFHRDAFNLSHGQSVMAWIAIEGGHAKVLFERPSQSGDVANRGILCTWIAYRARVSRSVKLANHVTASRVGGWESSVLATSLWRYGGSIALSPTKFFLSDETRALGYEEWFWDDQPISDQGVTLPGGSVILDTINRQLIVHLDQSGLPADDGSAAVSHTVRFRGKDVFGNTRETKLEIHTPAMTVEHRRIRLLSPDLIFPLRDPVRDQPEWDAVVLASILGELLASRVSPAEATSIGRALSDALSKGEGVLDSAAASAIVGLISGRHPA